MLIAFSPSTWKTFAATPGWLRIPAPTIETLPIASSVEMSSPTSRAADRVERRLQVVAPDREREVGAAVCGDGLVLDDHVHVHVRVGERAEDPPGYAGLVEQADDRHARLLSGVGDGCD